MKREHLFKPKYILWHTLYKAVTVCIIAVTLAGLIPAPLVRSVAPALADLLPPASVALAQGTNLIGLKQVNTTTPAAGETFYYTIKYRCASITAAYCATASVVDAVPAPLEIVDYTKVGGNVKTVSLSGNTLTWTLGTPVNALPPGVPVGELATGSTGIVKVAVRFPTCGVTAPPVSVTNTAIIAADGLSTNQSAPAVTTPAGISATCPPNPVPPAVGFSKVIFDGSLVLGLGGSTTYAINLPSSSTGYVVTETLPTGTQVGQATYQPTGQPGVWPKSMEVDCTDDGVANFFEISAQTNFFMSNWFGVNIANMSNLLDKNGNPTGCVGSLIYPVADPTLSFNYKVNVHQIRYTVPDNTIYNNVGAAYVQLYTDATGVGPIINNCADSSEHGTTCAPNIINIGTAPFLNSNKDFGILGTQANGAPQYSANGFLPLLNVPPTQSNDMVYIGSVDINTHSGSGINAPYIEDILPAELDYVTGVDGNWWRSAWGAAPNGVSVADPNLDPINQVACQTPVFTRTVQPDGRIKLRWEWPGCQLLRNAYSRPIGVWFSTRIKPGVVAGTNILNHVTVGSLEVGSLYCNTSSSTALSSDCPSYPISYIVPQKTDLNSVKWVKGALDPSYHRYPNSGMTDLAGDGTYIAEITHSGNVTNTLLDVVDILPWIGDQALVTAASRLSQWSEELALPITLQRISADGTTTTTVPAGELPLGIEYSTNPNLCYLDNATIPNITADSGVASNPSGCSTANWTGTAAGARAFALRWAPVVPFASGEKLRIIVPVRQLTGEADAGNQEIAWNSFAYSTHYWDSQTNSLQTLLSTEPPKVGLAMIQTAATAGLGDYVWFDSNGNGLQESGETPLAGVTVHLYDGASQVLTTTTDVNGYYAFWGLTPNHVYTVKLDNPSDFVAGAPLGGLKLTLANVNDPTSDASDSDAVLVGGYPTIATATTGAAGSFIPTYDFGFTILSAIGDKVWYDDNHDGAQDANELGVPGVTVTLKNVAGTTISTTTTSAAGTYLFDNLIPGDYYVVFSNLPAGYTYTLPDASGDDATDSDPDATGRTVLTNLAPGERDLTWDAGIYLTPLPPPAPATIGNRVWYDNNHDGIQDGDAAGETGVAGVKVLLLDAAGFPVSSLTTDASGYYTFTNLAPGSYAVKFDLTTLPVNYLPTLQGASGSSDPTDSDANLTTGETEVTVLDPNEVDPTWDLGIWTPQPTIVLKKYTNGEDADTIPGPTLKVGDVVTWTYNLTNTGNVTLTNITLVDDKEGTIACTPTTLAPGAATNCVQTGIAVAGQYSNTAVVTGTPTLGPVTPVTDTNPSHYNAPVKIGNRLWIESDSDGDATTGTVTPVVGQVVTATSSTGVVYTTTTDSNGLYTITVPANAVYTVTTGTPVGTVPSTLIATVANDANAVTNNDKNHRNTGTTVTVVTTDNLSIDFGFHAPVAQFGDRVWIESDSDGLASTGVITPVVGMVITATSGVQVYTTTTNSQGYYSFTVPVGTYTVTYGSVPASYGAVVPSSTPGGSSESGNAGAYAETGTPDQSHPNGTTVTVGAGEANWLVDFAFWTPQPEIVLKKYTNGEDADTIPGPTLQVGDVVTWTYNLTNTGNVTLTNITLVDDKEGTITCTPTTLAPGAATSCVQTGIAVAGQYSNTAVVTGTPTLGPVTPVTDTNPSHYNAPEAQFGDRVWIESDQDGIAATGIITPVAGMVITATNGAQVYTTTTNANGYYSFTVPVGTYTVTYGRVPASYGAVVPSSTPGGSSESGNAGAYAEAGTPDQSHPNGTTVTVGAGEANWLVDFAFWLPQPTIVLKKYTNGEDADTIPGPTLQVGDVVTWTYNLTNTGNVTLTNITLVDDKEGTIACTPTTLAPGAATSCVQTGIAVAGQYSNTAIVTGTPTLGPVTPVTSTNPSHYNAPVKIGNRLWIESDSDGDATTGTVTPVVGQMVTATSSTGVVYTTTTDSNGLYTITVPANDVYTVTTGTPVGTVPSTLIATVANDANAVANNDKNHLNTGTTVTVVTTDNLSIDFGFHAPVAQFGDRVWIEADQDGLAATGIITPVAGMVITATDGAQVYTTTTNSQGYYSFTVPVGTYTVTYGRVPASYGSVVPSSTPGGNSESGNAGAYAETGTPDESHLNGTTVTVGAGEANWHVDFAFWRPQPTIVVKKYTNGDDADTSTGPAVAVGSVVTWTYTLTNTGNVTLTNVRLVDDKEGGINCPQSQLAPQAHMTCVLTGVARAGLYVNTAVVTGTPTIGPVTPVTSTNPSHYHSVAPAIVVRKYTNGYDADRLTGPYIQTSGAVTWTYLITNTGDVTLTNVTLVDDKVGGITCPVTSLAPGATTLCTKLGIASIGQYTNTATVTGTNMLSSTQQVTSTNPSHYYGAAPQIVLKKYTNGEDADTIPGPQVIVGSVVTWTYRITNTGNVTLTNLTLIDDKVGGITCPVTSLVPGATTLCTKTGIAQLGQYTNTAVVTGTPALPPVLPPDLPTFPPVPPPTTPVTDTNPSHYHAVGLSLGNRLWLDNGAGTATQRNNGVYDAGEPAVPQGVVVELLDQAGAVLRTTTTDSQGYYRFDDLAVGRYQVRIPANTFTPGGLLYGYLSSTGQTGTFTTGTNNHDHGDDQVSDGVTSGLVTLSVSNALGEVDSGASGAGANGPSGDAEDNLTVDFGFVAVASFGNFVWIESDSDGDAHTGTITPVAGQVITATDSSGQVYTTTTNSQGYYSFTVPVGTYTVSYGHPPIGTLPSATPNDGTVDQANPGTDQVSQPNNTIVTLLPGDHLLTVDFGFYQLAGLGDYVWLDQNLNGLQDNNEVGVPNVVVHLYTATGDVVATTTTDAQGHYQFIDLLPGQYYVGFVLPPSYSVSPQHAGTDGTHDSDVDAITGHTQVITIGPGEYNPNLDAGIFQTPAALGEEPEPSPNSRLYFPFINR